MKRFVNMTGKLLGATAAVAMVMAGAPADVQAKEGKAVVRKLNGDAQYSTGQGTWMVLREGQTLRAGATVRTQSDSQLVLFLGPNGPFITLIENTVLGLEQLTFERVGGEVLATTVVNLRSGAIHGEVRKMAESSEYKVKTSRSDITVQGPSTYFITAESRTTAQTGRVMVVYQDPQTGESQDFVVQGGNTFDPAAMDVRPATPDELAVPPALREMPGRAPTVEAEAESEIFVSPVSAGAGAREGSSTGQ